MTDNALQQFGDTLKQSMEHHFLAPSGMHGEVEFADDRFTIDAKSGLGRTGKVVVGFVGFAFLALTVAAVVTSGFEWPLLCFGGFGLLAVLLVVAPQQTWRVEVTEAGIRSNRNWGRDRTDEFYPAEQVADVRFVSDETPFSDDEDIDEWRLGVRLTTGETVGIMEDYRRGRVRAAAELVHRLVEAGKGRSVPLVTHPLASGRAEATLAFGERPGDRDEVDLDATLVERAQSRDTPMPLPNRHFEVLHTPTGLRIDCHHRHPIATLVAVAPYLVPGLVFAGGFGTAIYYGVQEMRRAEALAQWELVVAGVVMIIPLVLFSLGLGSLLWTLLLVVGTEYVRIESGVIERGVHCFGLDWGRRRFALSAVGEMRVRPFPLSETLTRGIAVYDDGEPRPLGFRSIARRDAEWLVAAITAAVREAARYLPTDAPPGWPEHPRIDVQVRDGEVRIAAQGRRWGWLLGAFVFGLGFVGLGLCGTVMLVAGAVAEFRRGEIPLPILIVIFLFVAVPLFFAGVGGFIVKTAWQLFGTGSNLHIIGGGELCYDGLSTGERDCVALRRVRRVKIDRGNLALVTDTGDVTLGFHNLKRAEDLEWARAAVAYAVRQHSADARPTIRSLPRSIV